MSRDRNDADKSLAPVEKKSKSTRGFASMDPELKREIASKGGRAAHALGRAHEFNSEEGRQAGRKGGLTVSQDRKHMSDIGKIGGKSRRGKDSVSKDMLPKSSTPGSDTPASEL